MKNVVVCKCVCVVWNTGNAIALMEENANYVVDDANYSLKNVISLFLAAGHYLHVTELYGISFEDKN